MIDMILCYIGWSAGWQNIIQKCGGFFIKIMQLAIRLFCVEADMSSRLTVLVPALFMLFKIAICVYYSFAIVVLFDAFDVLVLFVCRVSSQVPVLQSYRDKNILQVSSLLMIS